MSKALLSGCAVALLLGYIVGVAVRSRINVLHLQLATLVLAGCGAIATIAKGAT